MQQHGYALRQPERPAQLGAHQAVDPGQAQRGRGRDAQPGAAVHLVVGAQHQAELARRGGVGDELAPGQGAPDGGLAGDRSGRPGAEVGGVDGEQVQPGARDLDRARVHHDGLGHVRQLRQREAGPLRDRGRRDGEHAGRGGGDAGAARAEVLDGRGRRDELVERGGLLLGRPPPRLFMRALLRVPAQDQHDATGREGDGEYGHDHEEDTTEGGKTGHPAHVNPLAEK
jgi:hypothetical protein